MGNGHPLGPGSTEQSSIGNHRKLPIRVLTYFLNAGSPQSKKGEGSKEDKLDYILRKLDPGRAEAILRSLDEKYPSNKSRAQCAEGLGTDYDEDG